MLRGQVLQDYYDSVKIPQLRKLSWHGGYISGGGNGGIMGTALGRYLCRLPELQYLLIDGNYMYRDGIKSLVDGIVASGGALKHLHTLNLSFNQMGSAGTKYFAHNWPKDRGAMLKSLVLTRNAIGITGINALACQLGSRFPNLERIELSENTFNERCVAPKHHLLNLQTFSACGMRGHGLASEASVIQLTKWLDKMPNLEILQLDRNAISCEGIALLMGYLTAATPLLLRMLRMLSLSKNVYESNPSLFEKDGWHVTRTISRLHLLDMVEIVQLKRDN